MTTITIDRAVVQQALEALLWHDTNVYADRKEKAITALRAALAQTEPVQRKPLTEDEIEALFKGVDSEDKGRFAIVRGFARAVERAHGIGKESGDER